jgi:hypothetical protein
MFPLPIIRCCLEASRRLAVWDNGGCKQRVLWMQCLLLEPVWSKLPQRWTVLNQSSVSGSVKRPSRPLLERNVVTSPEFEGLSKGELVTTAVGGCDRCGTDLQLVGRMILSCRTAEHVCGFEINWELYSEAIVSDYGLDDRGSIPGGGKGFFP